MTVGWTANACRELRAIHDFIAQNSPRYAQGVVDRSHGTQSNSRNSLGSVPWWRSTMISQFGNCSSVRIGSFIVLARIRWLFYQ